MAIASLVPAGTSADSLTDRVRTSRSPHEGEARPMMRDSGIESLNQFLGRDVQVEASNHLISPTTTMPSSEIRYQL